MPENKRDIALLFTSAFPFGKGEQFIETEILYLAGRFKEVHVFPIELSGEKRSLPANVTVKEFPLYRQYSRKNLLARRLLRLKSWYIRQLFLSSHKAKYLFRPRFHFNYLMHRTAEAERLGEIIAAYDPERTIIYSYWFNVWTTVLLLSRKLGYFRTPIVTRAHGGDLDEQQRKENYFPFRSLEMKWIDRVYPVSDYGKRLLVDRYAASAAKIETARLGVSDQGDNPQNNSGEVRIVSCSFVYGLKRLHLIAEILSRLEMKIHWVHFGEGELLEELKTRAAKLPSNIRVEFKGHVSNRSILDYYKNEPVDLFMNVSELEGIPVSIMEAISFGIPVTGCNICGVPEIVTEETGFLLEKNFDPEQVAGRVREYLKLSASEKQEFRKRVKAYWKQHYNSEQNYTRFTEGLARL
jgi:colanic acid/amylovoran biosynthesis glycosyltransferase